MAQDAWDLRDLERVIKVCTPATCWRNRTEFSVVHDPVHAFLVRTWANEILLASEGMKI